MKTLAELSKQANELYAKFLSEQEEILANEARTMNGGVTEEEQQEILAWIHDHDFMDTEEYDMPEDTEGYGPTGHWDEQSFLNYTYATDEDGEWINPYNTDF